MQKKLIWKLDVDCDTYRIFYHDKPIEYCLQMRQLFNKEVSIKPNWEKTVIKLFEGESGKKRNETKKQIPDFFDGVVSIALNDKAKSIFQPLICNYVEYFDLYFNETIFHEMNISQLDCLNTEKSEIKYFTNSTKVLRVVNYSFNWDVVANTPIFCITNIGALPIIVSDEFKKIYEDHSLTGLIFDPIPLIN